MLNSAYSNNVLQNNDQSILPQFLENYVSLEETLTKTTRMGFKMERYYTLREATIYYYEDKKIFEKNQCPKGFFNLQNYTINIDKDSLQISLMGKHEEEQLKPLVLNFQHCKEKQKDTFKIWQSALLNNQRQDLHLFYKKFSQQKIGLDNSYQNGVSILQERKEKLQENLSQKFYRNQEEEQMIEQEILQNILTDQNLEQPTQINTNNLNGCLEQYCFFAIESFKQGLSDKSSQEYQEYLIEFANYYEQMPQICRKLLLVTLGCEEIVSEINIIDALEGFLIVNCQVFLDMEKENEEFNTFGMNLRQNLKLYYIMILQTLLTNQGYTQYTQNCQNQVFRDIFCQCSDQIKNIQEVQQENFQTNMEHIVLDSANQLVECKFRRDQ